MRNFLDPDQIDKIQNIKKEEDRYVSSKPKIDLCSLRTKDTLYAPVVLGFKDKTSTLDLFLPDKDPRETKIQQATQKNFSPTLEELVSDFSFKRLDLEDENGAFVDKNFKANLISLTGTRKPK